MPARNPHLTGNHGQAWFGGFRPSSLESITGNQVVLVHLHAGVIHVWHSVASGLGCLAGGEPQHRGGQGEKEDITDNSFHGVAWFVVCIPPFHAEKGVGNHAFTGCVPIGRMRHLVLRVAKRRPFRKRHAQIFQ